MKSSRQSHKGHKSQKRSHKSQKRSHKSQKRSHKSQKRSHKSQKRSHKSQKRSHRNRKSLLPSLKLRGGNGYALNPSKTRIGGLAVVDRYSQCGKDNDILEPFRKLWA